MCGINNVLAFKGGTHHKRKEDILLLISLLLPVVSVKNIIENSPFFAAPICVFIWKKICQVSIIKMYEFHSQISVYLQFMNPFENKGGKLDQYSWPQKLLAIDLCMIVVA